MNDDEGWLGRILFDSRERALQAKRATIGTMQKELDQQRDERALLAARCERLADELACERSRVAQVQAQVQVLLDRLQPIEDQLGCIDDELARARSTVKALRAEYSKAAVRGKLLETRIVGLLRRLLGGEAAPIIIELLEPRGVETSAHHSERERHLLHLLEGE